MMVVNFDWRAFMDANSIKEPSLIHFFILFVHHISACT